VAACPSSKTNMQALLCKLCFLDEIERRGPGRVCAFFFGRMSWIP
jgi:hypothetical protein